VNGLRRGGRRRGGVHRRGLLHARIRRLHWWRRRLRAVRGLARHLSRARSRLATTGRGSNAGRTRFNDSLCVLTVRDEIHRRSSVEPRGLTHTFHRGRLSIGRGESDLSRASFSRASRGGAPRASAGDAGGRQGGRERSRVASCGGVPRLLPAPGVVSRGAGVSRRAF
jgi:hypothetical protein